MVGSLLVLMTTTVHLEEKKINGSNNSWLKLIAFDFTPDNHPDLFTSSESKHSNWWTSSNLL